MCQTRKIGNGTLKKSPQSAKTEEGEAGKVPNQEHAHRFVLHSRDWGLGDFVPQGQAVDA